MPINFFEKKTTVYKIGGDAGVANRKIFRHFRAGRRKFVGESFPFGGMTDGFCDTGALSDTAVDWGAVFVIMRPATGAGSITSNADEQGKQ